MLEIKAAHQKKSDKPLKPLSATKKLKK